MTRSAEPSPGALGVVADDVTGACDLAARVTEAGLPAVVHLGAGPDLADDAACSVVALKVRTADPGVAATAAAAATHRLLAAGARTIYQKYCSTFDSTARGNIGPIADAMAETLGGAAGAATAVGTPATPGSGRVQRGGVLLVDGRPLADTAMRDHPLTPMRDSDLVRLLRPQTARPVGLVRLEVVRRGPDAVRSAIERLEQEGAGHVLVDAVEEQDLDALAAAVDDGRRVLGGAAGLAAAVARRRGRTGTSAQLGPVPLRGRLVLSGSASARTRQQVAAFTGPVVRVDPVALEATGDEPLLRAVAQALGAAGSSPVLVSATAPPAAVLAAQRALGAAAAAELVERALAAVAAAQVAAGRVSHLLVAGGETSGAVVAALGVRRLVIGRSAAPGVPWAVAAGDDLAEPLALLLKSGNFGAPDLFRTAWRTAP